MISSEQFLLYSAEFFSLCNWIMDFLTGRPQSVRVGHNTSSTTTLSTGAPQGCVLSPLLFMLLTHDCTAKFSSNHIIKFGDDTTVVGLISNNDETHYREEVAQLAEMLNAELIRTVSQFYGIEAEKVFTELSVSCILPPSRKVMSRNAKVPKRQWDWVCFPLSFWTPKNVCNITCLHFYSWEVIF